MEHFEQELRKAMARREPSADFTARVLAAAKAASKQGRESRFHWRNAIRAWALVPVFGVLALIFGMSTYQQHQRTVKGEEAKQQVLMAMRIAGSKLYDVQVHIREVAQ